MGGWAWKEERWVGGWLGGWVNEPASRRYSIVLAPSSVKASTMRSTSAPEREVWVGGWVGGWVG